MSLGYAEKLSYIEDVGKVGMAGFFDSLIFLEKKMSLMSLLVENARQMGFDGSAFVTEVEGGEEEVEEKGGSGDRK